MRSVDNTRTVKGGWVYIMTNRPNGTLYVGTTTELGSAHMGASRRRCRRVHKQYGLTRLVYAERHDDILAAKQRERNMKRWSRAWKVTLILRTNPNWEDLYDRLG
jgi:putative endonuclease